MRKSNSVPPTTVEEYLAGLPEPARTTLRKLRTTIRAAVPKAATEGISWGMPMFKHEGMLLGLAAFSKHCSIFPGPTVIAALKDDLKDFRTSKGTIQFPLDEPLSAPLVKKIVKARLAENAQRNRK
jgi:uncharacterized protein YdhG (YjbR/CyaY superfamily)